MVAIFWPFGLLIDLAPFSDVMPVPVTGIQPPHVGAAKERLYSMP